MIYQCHWGKHKRNSAINFLQQLNIDASNIVINILSIQHSADHAIHNQTASNYIVWTIYSLSLTWYKQLTHHIEISGWNLCAVLYRTSWWPTEHGCVMCALLELFGSFLILLQDMVRKRCRCLSIACISRRVRIHPELAKRGALIVILS